MKIDPADPRFEHLRGKKADELATIAANLRSEAQTLLTRSDNGSLSPEDSERFDQLDADLSFLKHVAEKRSSMLDLVSRGAYEDQTTVNSHERQSRTEASESPLSGTVSVRKDQSVHEWARVNGHIADGPTPNFGKFVRGVVSGEWDGAERERALSEGSFSSGGALVPTPLATVLIDAARNQSVLGSVGATVFPMTSQTLRVPRLVSEATPAWRVENAPVSTGDLAFDQVTFTARSIDKLILLSRELFEDSDPSAAAIIEASFAAQFALELDRVAFFGSGTAPEPRGVANDPLVTKLTNGANGAALSYDQLIDASTTVRDNNFTPDFHVLAPKTRGALAKQKNSQGDYLTPPPGLLPIYDTKNVATGVTTGTSTDTTSIITGQGALLGVGIRTQFNIRILTERYADTGQIGIIANLRCDTQILQPKAFVVSQGIRVS